MVQFQASTSFGKKDLFGLTKDGLAKMYINILEKQEINNITYEDGIINFKKMIFFLL